MVYLVPQHTHFPRVRPHCQLLDINATREFLLWASKKWNARCFYKKCFVQAEDNLNIKKPHNAQHYDRSGSEMGLQISLTYFNLGQ